MVSSNVEQTTSTLIQFESILNEINSFGKFQLINLIIICVLIFQYGTFGFAYIYTAGDLNYRCEIEQCDHVDNHTEIEYNPSWLKIAVPFDNGKPSQCLMYNNTSDNCTRVSFDNTTIKCDRFIYEDDRRTIVNDWGLNCDDNKWKLAIVGTVNSVGLFFGISLSGYFSDKYGRKTIVIVGMTLCAIFGVIKSFSWNYEIFLLFEFIERTFGAGVYSTAFVLGMEQVGFKHRRIGGAVIPCAYSIGQAFLGVSAMLWRNWRLMLLTNASLALLIILYIWWIPESVRWLIVKGKHAKAIQVIRKTIRINKIELSEKSKKIIKEHEKDRTVQQGVTTINESNDNRRELLKMMRSCKMFTRFLNCSFCWIANVFVYYGMSIASVAIGGNKYTNFIYVSLIDCPSYIVCYFLTDKIGRKKTLFYALILSGISCVFSGFFIHMEFVTLILFLLGKFAITLAFSVLYIYTTELFPTNLRNSMMGICSTIGRIGSMIAPQTPLLNLVSTSLPMIVFGIVALLAGILSLQFPETLNTELPNTVDEAIAIGEKSKVEIKSQNPDTDRY